MADVARDLGPAARAGSAITGAAFARRIVDLRKPVRDAKERRQHLPASEKEES